MVAVHSNAVNIFLLVLCILLSPLCAIVSRLVLALIFFHSEFNSSANKKKVYILQIHGSVVSSQLLFLEVFSHIKKM